MSVDLKASIVRVARPDGTTVGTGFVVAGNGLIATCAHVVEAAVDGPEDSVRMVFHATGEEHEAQVEPDWWRAPDVVSALLNALNHEDAIVRSRGAWALGSATVHCEVVRALLVVLHDEDAFARKGAA